MPHIACTYRIPALDRGGSWAVIEAKLLKARWAALNARDSAGYPDQDTSGWKILREFDLIAANSGANLVLAALACNWRLSEVITALASPTGNPSADGAALNNRPRQ